MKSLKKQLIFSFFLLMAFPVISFSQTNFSINITGKNAKCNSNANGSATVTVNGANSNSYTYNWSPTGGTAAIANNLVAGTYKVLVTDNNGFSVLDSITIAEPPPLTVYIDSIVVQPCFLKGGGVCGCGNTLWAVVNGGTAPYRYYWSPGGQRTDSIFNVCYVNFTVNVTDTNNCSSNASLNVVIPPKPSATGISEVSGNSSQIKVYPNPANDQLFISLEEATDNAKIEVYDMLGNKVIEHKINATILSNIDVSNLMEGNYFLRIIDSNGQKTNRFSINR